MDSTNFESLPLMNAAGHCKHLNDVKELARTPVTAITVGSITVEPRGGNPGNVYWHEEESGASLNVLGLPNPGMEQYAHELPKMVETARTHGKKLRVSIAGFSPDEYRRLAGLCFKIPVDEIELNVGCPNVFDGGSQKKIASFHPDTLRAILEGVAKERRRTRSDAVSISVKLSPFSDPHLLEGIAGIIAESAANAVICSNTFPNAIAFENGRPTISFGNGLAGLAGTPMRHIALGQVRQFRTLLPEKIKVIGVGGVSSGHHVRDYLRAGADGVQIGSRYFKYGAKVFSEILQDLVK